MKLLRRALVLGAAFGLSAAAVELWASLIPFMERRMGPGPLYMAQVAALLTGLGALLGLALAPLLRAGAVLHVLAIALAWYGLERWVRLDSPAFAMTEVARPVGGALLTLLGLWLGRARPRLAWALGGLLLLAGLVAPRVYLHATTPPLPPRAELPPAQPGAPNVVLVVLDTVRAGNVSGYGYARPTAPEIDRLAAEGALFLDATSPSTWSLPSHASLFTGRYPSSHGAHGEHRYLDARYPTLAQVLERRGYETFCITANPWISDGLGLTRGFAWQDLSLREQGGAGQAFSFVHRLLDRLGLLDSDKGGDAVAASFEAWARERPAGGRPAFVFLNFIEAHFPYHQLPKDALFQFTDRPYGDLRQISIDLTGQQFGGKGRPVAEAGGPAKDMYDGGIVYSSRLLGRVTEALRARGLLDQTVLVVLADHGEILGERGDYFGHGPTLYQEAIGVPLLVRYPPRIPAGVRVAQPVSTLGVFATVLDLAGIEAPPTLQVGSLAPLARGESRDGGGPILSELHVSPELIPSSTSKDPQMKYDRRYRLLREGSFKLIETSKGEAFFYDLAADPGETRDLAAERPSEVSAMRARLAKVEAAIGLPAIDAPLAADGETPELDEATREHLRALGYAD